MIITDNGSEFSNPKKIEYREYAVTGYGFKRTSVFTVMPDVLIKRVQSKLITS